MRNFFHGWRRKSGVVTLVVACLLVVLWARSTVIVDSINFEIGNQLYVIWSAPDGCFVALGDRMPAELRGPGRQGFTDFSWYARTPDELMKKNGYYRAGSIREVADRHRPNDQYVTLHYSWLTIPLTFLSAYLILCDPRNRA